MLSADESKSPAPCLALEQPQDEPAQGAIHVQTRPQPPSPVFGLPHELLRYIFRTLFDEHLLTVTAWRRRNHTKICNETPLQAWRLPQVQHPWVITLQICRLWRRVAMDYSGLWTEIASRWPTPIRVALPSIEHISVIDEVLCMNKFLSYFPLSCTIRNRFTMFDENSPPIANYIRHLAVLYLTSQISSLMGSPIDTLVFAEDIIANHKPFYKLELDAQTVSNSQTSTLSLIFDCISDSNAHLPCFQMILDGLGEQLSHVDSMWLLDMDAYMDIDWSRPLARMRALRKLKLSIDNPDAIVELMGSVAAEHRNEQTGITEREVYLPALECLTISLMERDEELFELVARSLERRMNLGSRLPMLDMHIERGTLKPEDEVLLSRVSTLVSEDETGW